MNWDEILTRLQDDRNNESAWSSLFDRGWPIAVATAARQLGNKRERLDEVAQESLVRLLKYCRFERLIDGASLQSYLKETVRNVARDFGRSLAQGPERQLIDVDDVVDKRAATGEMNAVAREFLQHSSLRGLDKIDRLIVDGLMAGQSRFELQNATGLNYSALNVRIHRLRKALRKLAGG